MKIQELLAEDVHDPNIDDKRQRYQDLLAKARGNK